MTFINAKTIAMTCMLGIGAALGAILTTYTEGKLFKTEEAHAQTKTSIAEIEKAKAALLDAENKLKAQETLALAQIKAAMLQAQAIIAAANQQSAATIAAARQMAQGQIASSQIMGHADNETYDKILAPLVAEPIKHITTLNQKVVRLEQEVSSGLDSRTHRRLSDLELAERLTEKAATEGELGLEVAGTQKSYRDAVGMIFGVAGAVAGEVLGTGRNPSMQISLAGSSR